MYEAVPSSARLPRGPPPSECNSRQSLIWFTIDHTATDDIRLTC
eukprot:CAMPEP_0176099940 /NCGR_PEP_ID=MMETSP0120_2-20121206/50125_1 /TAXON_ID=160619 /ORGANISM="Kryptoperidinium foliaceum, Strain CCMP 1326" /LENGTH=43 /DNA_ID= /DNA_START= /DNA_END= /DNA_ORIENTATION=